MCFNEGYTSVLISLVLDYHVEELTYDCGCIYKVAFEENSERARPGTRVQGEGWLCIRHTKMLTNGYSQLSE
jgi:hypothetical protein